MVFWLPDYQLQPKINLIHQVLLLEAAKEAWNGPCMRSVLVVGGLSIYLVGPYSLNVCKDSSRLLCIVLSL